MPTYGVYERTKPRVRVLRGFAGNEPQSLTKSAIPATGEDIKSGQLIVLGDNGQWYKALRGGTASTNDSADEVVYVAYQDQTDTDVTSSGKLMGFSCLGDFEFQTAYFDAAVTGADNQPLTVSDAVAGNLDVGTDFATEDLIGIVTGGKVDLAGQNSEVAKDSNGNIYVIQWAAMTKFQ